jgi:hypothetical protein
MIMKAFDRLPDAPPFTFPTGDNTKRRDLHSIAGRVSGLGIDSHFR